MSADALNQRVIAIKGDKAETEKLISEFKPFIIASAGKVTGRYMRQGLDDEVGIAMLAFAEAIGAYEISRGSFLSFAGRVIKSRLIDYYRKEKKHSNVISINQSRTDEDEETDLSTRQSLEKESENYLTQMRRAELVQLREELGEWGISFVELAESSPKHKRTRQICNEIVGFLLSRKDLLSQIKEIRQLPISEIEKELQIPRKIVERSRRYIISVILVMTGDYQYIRDYAWQGNRRESPEEKI